MENIHTKEQHEHIMEFLPDAVFIHRFGTIVYANTAGIKLLGASDPSKIIQKPTFDFVHPSYHNIVIK